MDYLFSQQELEDILNNHYPKHYVKAIFETPLEFLKDVDIRDDDVFLIGNPKSGTTWLQELVWLIGNDLNFEGANVFIDERVPVLEIEAFLKEAVVVPHIRLPNCHRHSLNYVHQLKSPRFIKTHVAPKYLPVQLLSGKRKAKIIYISRNAKDVCLSSYHYTKNILKHHDCCLDDFCKVFMSYRSTYWDWESILYFWNLRNENNILFVRYEEMKNNLGEVIQRVAQFLNKTVTDVQQKELEKWLHFDKMKVNNAVNHNNIYENSGFIRKGSVGGYKTEMSPEMISLFDLWITESLKGSDYHEYKL